MSNETNIAAMPESEEEIAALVSEIAAGLNAIAKNEVEKGTPLRKAAPPPPEDEGSEPSPEPSPEPSADASAGGPPPGEEPGMPADDGAAAGGPPPGPEGAPEGAGGPEAGGAPSVEELVQLYSQLPDEQFEAHFMAIQQVAEQKQGGASPDQGAGGPPPGPPPGPSASAGGPPPSAGAPMAMSETAREEIEGLKKSVSLLTQALETVTNAPLRKSVTRYENGIAYIPYQGAVVAPDHKPLRKSFKELTKSEVHEKLKEITADPKLAKSDRELINGYYSRSVALDKLEKFFQ